MEGLRKLVQEEPVLLVGLVQSGIAVGTAFGLGWTAEQVAIVLAFTQTLLSVIARSMVTPTAKAEEAVAEAKAEAKAEAIVERAMSPDLTAEEWSSLQELRAERDALLKERGT